MPFKESCVVEGGCLLLWDLTNAEEVELLKSKFAEHDKFQQITHPNRQYEWLAVVCLLMQVGIGAEQLYYEESGRPHLSDSEYKYISISHSDNLVGVFLHKERAVGLDIESIHRPFPKVVNKYLVDREQQLAETIEDGLCVFWCVKEAMYKLAAQVGMDYKNTIQIDKQNEGLAVSLSNQKSRSFSLFKKKIQSQIIIGVVEQS